MCKDLGTCAFKISQDGRCKLVRDIDAGQHVGALRCVSEGLPEGHPPSSSPDWVEKSVTIGNQCPRRDSPHGIEGKIQEFRHRGVGREDE